MSNFRCRFSLGNDQYVLVNEWKGELRGDLREWKDDKPTKKGISLLQWKNWVNQIEYADAAQQEKMSIVMKQKTVCVCVDIRQCWKPQEELVTTKKGICLRPSEYNRLKELLPEIGNVLSELGTVHHVSCIPPFH